MARRVAALFSSRRDEGADGAAGGELEVDTQLHYVHVCTLRKISCRPAIPAPAPTETPTETQVQGDIHMDFTART